MITLKDYSLAYAKLGWRVLPLKPRHKEPITAHGVKDASSDAGQIEAWWTTTPEANIGLACGKDSGVFCVDVDTDQANGVDGYASVRELTGGKRIERTVSQLTPSGGLHLLYKTDNPPPNKNGFVNGIDIRSDNYYIVLAPSVLDPYGKCPTGGAYQWIEHLDPWKATPLEYPGWARPKAKVPIAPVPTGVPVVDNADRPMILMRAERWLLMADPAIAGCCGHHKLLWACQGMVTGFLLSNEEAYELLARVYNPGCTPPWDLSDAKDYREFRRKIDQARENPPRDKPKGWLLLDTSWDTVSDTSNVDALYHRLIEKHMVDAGMETVGEPTTYIPASGEVEFLTTPPGLIGEICSWINSGSPRRQPMLSLACTLAYLGALYGRRIKDESGGRTNIYCMGIADSSWGKGHAPSCIRTLAAASGTLPLLGGSDLASDTSIEERMSKAPSTVWYLDEVAHLLASSKNGRDQHRFRIVSTLMRFWSSAKDVFLGREYADQEQQRVIFEPNACIYGTAVPSRFTSGLDPEELQDGWLARCLIFLADKRPTLVQRPEIPPPDSIISKCHEWLGRGLKEQEEKPTFKDIRLPVTKFDHEDRLKEANPTLFITTERANKIFMSFNAEAEGYADEDYQIGAIWLKAHENARRIGLIVAASDLPDGNTVDEHHADYAVRLVRHLVRQFVVNIAPEITDNELQARKMQVLKLIRSFGGDGCPKSRLTNLTKWADSRYRDNIMRDLIEGCEVFPVQRGRGTTFFTKEFTPK